MTSTSAIVTSAALIGHSLADDKALATLPLAVQFVAVMAVTAPGMTAPPGFAQCADRSNG